MRYPVNYIAIAQGYHFGKCLDFGWNALHGGSKAPIYSVEAGKVLIARNYKSSGYTIIIEHKDGKCSLYAHMSKLVVKEGANVTLGQQIGNMGATGTDCKGTHLHFGLYSKKELALAFKHSDLDPFKYLEVYKGQEVGNNTKKNYGDKIKYHKEEKVVTAKPCLNVRNKPSILGKKIGVVNYNTKVKVYATSGSWSKIAEKEEKWVSSSYLK